MDRPLAPHSHSQAVCVRGCGSRVQSPALRRDSLSAIPGGMTDVRYRPRPRQCGALRARVCLFVSHTQRGRCRRSPPGASASVPPSPAWSEISLLPTTPAPPPATGLGIPHDSIDSDLSQRGELTPLAAAASAGAGLASQRVVYDPDPLIEIREVRSPRAGLGGGHTSDWRLGVCGCSLCE